MPAQIGQMKMGEVLAYLQYVAQLAQNADFVTDFAVGLPGTRSDITKGEVQIKTAQSLAIFDMMGKNLEHFGRECVEMTVNFLSQYLSDFTDPQVAELIGPENAQVLMSLPLHERINELQGDFVYSFTGVSQALQKEDMLRRVVQFGQLAASVPYIQIIGQQSPKVFVQILNTIRDLLGLGDKITLPEDQEMMAGAAQPTMPLAPGGAMPGSPDELVRAAAAQAQGAGMANQGNGSGMASQPARMGA